MPQTIPWDKPIVVSRSKTCPYRNIALSQIEGHSMYQTNVLEIDSLETMITMIEKNVGCGVLPTKLIESYDKLEEMLTSPLLEKVQIHLYVLKTNQRKLKDFVDTIITKQKESTCFR